MGITRDRELIADIIYSFCWLVSDDRDDALDLADRIIDAGYVQLDPDQSLPKNPDVPDEYNELACGAEDDSDNIAKSFYELGQQDMLKQGWRKVAPNQKTVRRNNEYRKV